MSIDRRGSAPAPLGDSYNEQWKALGAWFLGPRAENCDVFLDTFKDIFKEHVRLRNNYFPSDPAYITPQMRSSHAYHSEVEDMKRELMRMHKEMENNVPFFSPRYQAHMVWDSSMPALLGYMGAMLFNQNNTDSAMSPVTTLYERQVGQQLCNMLGYNIFPDKKEPVAWGHITCGGSIANIEALWASRNIKFVPLAVKAALLNNDPEVGALTFLSEEQVKMGLKTPLLVFNKESRKREPTPLKDCSNWQLLNVDVDEICDLAENVITTMKRISPGSLDKNRFTDLIEREGIMSLGLYNFLKKHGIENSPVYTAPAHNHYSWPKAGTLLGLGCNALTPIQLDVHFRQDVGHLKKVLQHFLENEIPIISAVAVMGSTEESAVDPIAEMHALREEFKEKGLNFTLLADGAWGGYFKTMLIDNPTSDNLPEFSSLDKCSKRKSDGFVPYCELSPFVRRQYEHIQLADTITIDPHKSGFCPYPGGGLCYRNEKMRYHIALFHPEVFHGEGDPSMGVYGVEGSKPGASPAGILVSHNVIGLSNRGYGRILGQCTATTKLFYALWLTLAKDDDPFVCVPLQNIPDGYEMESVRKLIKDKIAYKNMAEIFEDSEALQFLQLCGPDTMINTIVINFRDNDDVEKANELQLALYEAMSIFVGTKASRIPLMIMQSGLDAKTHGEGLKVFKERSGLRADDDKDMNVLVNTCMNPWQQNESISEIGDLFRMIMFNCIGRIKDSVVKHRFILSGSYNEENEDESIFIEYQTGTDIPEHQYQVSAKVEGDSKDDRESLRKYVQHCSNKNISAVFETITPSYDWSDKDVPNLYNILHLTNWDQKISVKLVDDPAGNIVSLKILDIPRYQRLDMSATVSYPEKQKYFLYGDANRTIMSHVIAKLPDIQHTVTLTGRPHSMTAIMQDLGVVAQLEGIEGTPLEIDGEVKNPFQRSCYEVTFIGELNTTIRTNVNIKETVIFKTVKLSTE
ncbi:hypothetical protein ACHWQZ_G013636 [Mnemiopsis leidyi]